MRYRRRRGGCAMRRRRRRGRGKVWNWVKGAAGKVNNFLKKTKVLSKIAAPVLGAIPAVSGYAGAATKALDMAGYGRSRRYRIRRRRYGRRRRRLFGRGFYSTPQLHNYPYVTSTAFPRGLGSQ